MTGEEIRFRIPESRVLSVRLNRNESRVLTDAARRRGMKLSTYIKGAALDAAELPLTSAPDDTLRYISHSLEVERTTA